MFSIYEVLEPTSEDIVVTFTPDINIARYVYRIYRDGEVISSVKTEGNIPTDIKLDTTGNYVIMVEGFSIFEEKVEYTSGKYVVDKDAPSLRVGESYLKFTKNDTLKVMDKVKAVDNTDGDITSTIKTNINEIDLSKVGKQNLIYTVSDSAGNVATKTVTLDIVKSNAALLITIQIAIIVLLFLIMNKLNNYLNSIKMEKRFGKYAIEPTVDDAPALYDIIYMFYDSVVKSLGEVLRKSAAIKKYAKRYDKYMLFIKDKYKDSVNIVAAKILCSIAFLIIAVITKAIQYKTLTVHESLIPLVFGFFIPDIYYAVKNRIYRSRIENDLLQAVIIMNNAFKSGRSIVQAIDLVGHELPGIIGSQFVIMKKELAKGLSLDVVFQRFASRVNVEEVNYLTASLSILNRTGGNIIKVFDAIENSLFMKKKLRLELRSLTGSSKIIMWILFLIPIAYVLIISILNPTYFDPFFNTPLGIILITISVLLYVVYIYIVSKILKVRM